MEIFNIVRAPLVYYYGYHDVKSYRHYLYIVHVSTACLSQMNRFSSVGLLYNFHPWIANTDKSLMTDVQFI